jgi:hypothetical protein
MCQQSKITEHFVEFAVVEVENLRNALFKLAGYNL